MGNMGVGQVLFYRVRLEGALAAVVSVTVSPVRRRKTPGLGAGAARVTVRYALAPSGQVCTHRGWLYTDLPPSTRLGVVGCQVDGTELLLSLRPVRSPRLTTERLDDRFRLAFALPAWPRASLQGISARLSVGCRISPEGLLLRGRLLLVLDGEAGPLRFVLPFCRLVVAVGAAALDWRAYGAVAGVTCRLEPAGHLVGEAALSVICVGRPPAGDPPAEERPAPAVVRALSGEVARVAAEPSGEGRALVRGAVALDLEWFDRAGRSRWTGLEAPFSTLVDVPGLAVGDRLEPAAQIERITRLGDRAVVLLAVGVTVLRTVHLPLDGQYYRMEQVMGQAVATLAVDQPLFAQPAPVKAKADSVRVEVGLPAGEREGWQALGLKLRPPAVAGGTWRSRLLLVEADAHAGQPQRRAVLPVGGAGEPLLIGLESVGRRGVRVTARVIDAPPGGCLAAPERALAQQTAVELDLGGPVRALSGLHLRGGPPWEARLLVHGHGGMQLVAADLPPPGSGCRPLTITACCSAPNRWQLRVLWRAEAT
jgi:hypothetical protein